MRSRNLKFANNDFDKCEITQNQTIMSLVAKYVCKEQLKEEILALINHMRLRKKVYLPCKLVGVDGNTKMKVFEEINECSSIR